MIKAMKTATISLLMMMVVVTMMLATLAFSQVSTPQSLTDAQRSELIEQVKQTPVSRLDSALPREKFAQWLERAVGPGAKIGWTIRYSPADATDDGRDFPTCVEADAFIEYGRSVVVLIGVGTPGKVGDRKPFVHQAQLMDRHDIVSLRHLSDIPAALRKFQWIASSSEAVR